MALLPQQLSDTEEKTLRATVCHKDEGENRRKLDRQDREKIKDELRKYYNPLLVDSPKLYNIVSGQCASEDVNVQNAL